MSYLKISLTTIFIASMVLFYRGNALVSSQSRRESENVNELKQKRIDLLQQRAEKLSEFLDAGKTDEGTRCLARIDLLEVQLEYADTLKEKTEKLNSLLEQFNIAIEHAKFLVDVPRRHAGNPIAAAVSNLYLLKAERVRFEIILQEL